LFLETKGKILNDLKAPTNKVKNIKTTKATKSTVVKANITTSIFNKTVYIGYSKSDIREVQQILRDLELYD
jgi:hypothetical protein